MSMETAYFLVVDGFIDAQVGLALTALRSELGIRVVTIGIGSLPVMSASGMRVVPEQTLAMTSLGSSSIVILPGAELWERSELPSLTSFLARAQLFRTPVAAIGNAIAPLACAGLLRSVPHARPCLTADSATVTTSLLAASPTLRADPVVVTSHIITACGQATIGFAAALLEHAGMPPAQVSAWIAAHAMPDANQRAGSPLGLH